MIDQLRLATQDDVAAIGALIDRSIRAFGRQVYDQAQVESSLRHVYGVDSRLIEDGTYFVIDGNEALTAAGGWSYRQTPFGGDQAQTLQSRARRQPGRDAAVIRAFYVDPSCARQGLGRRILQACEAAALTAGFERAELTSTEMGVRFYEAMGYTAVRPVPITLQDGVRLAFTLMHRQLAPPST